MTHTGLDTLQTRQSIDVDGVAYDFFSLKDAGQKIGDVSRLPYVLKILLENMLRCEEGNMVSVEDIEAIKAWEKDLGERAYKIIFKPAKPMGTPVEALAQPICVDADDAGRILYPMSGIGPVQPNAYGILSWPAPQGAVDAPALRVAIPKVLGVKFLGHVEAIDGPAMMAVVRQKLADKPLDGVVVEFCGEALGCVPLDVRENLVRLAQDCGAICGFCPLDVRACAHFKGQEALLRRYAAFDGYVYEEGCEDAIYSDALVLDISAFG